MSRFCASIEHKVYDFIRLEQVNCIFSYKRLLYARICSTGFSGAFCREICQVSDTEFDLLC